MINRDDRGPRSIEPWGPEAAPYDPYDPLVDPSERY